MPRLVVINGPNLNLLGKRETATYGGATLEQIESDVKKLASELGAEVEFFQSNYEGRLVDYIQEKADVDGIVINPGAYGHTSVAIRDALLATAVPFVEVHISNIYRREPFRHHTYLSDIASGVIVGLGARGYELAIRSLI